ncbi:MAG: hypothetical protein IKF97_03925 [Clostridia bacterium]|nr:hypothetical protein [Clostridia bacterium]
MGTLKKDVIRELKKNKEDKINPIVLDGVKKAKGEEQIAMVLLRYYVVDVLANCFEPSNLPKYWKEWAIKDYLKVVKKVKELKSEEMVDKINNTIGNYTFNLFDIDIAIRDSFCDFDSITEKYQNLLDEREKLHVYMITLIYDTLRIKSENLQMQVDEISRFMRV